jgi:hypothetical protein
MEQLAVVLPRASSTPLALEVLWPAEEGTLELISSEKCLISALSLTYEDTPTFTISSFQNLNFSGLKELQLCNFPSDQSRRMMDLALQSSCTHMIFDLQGGSHTPDLFKHKLIHQVRTLGINSC